MIELIQVPWSPYCLVLRRMLEFSGTPHRIINASATDRSLVWRLTRQRYYQVPILKDQRTVVFETEDNSQVIAKYLESKLQLGLFPATWEGVQSLLWRFIENDVEALTFKLNDAYFQEFVPSREQLAYLRHKERKFGRGCLRQWLVGQKQLLAELTERLAPFELMLQSRAYLLDERPLFVDFDLWGMLANFLYTGQYKLPHAHPRLKEWFERMSRLKRADSTTSVRRRRSIR